MMKQLVLMASGLRPLQRQIVMQFPRGLMTRKRERAAKSVKKILAVVREVERR